MLNIAFTPKYIRIIYYRAFMYQYYAMSTNTNAQNVLQFWFGPLKNSIEDPHEKSLMWFVNGKDYDDIIREKFGDLHQQACDGELHNWEQDPKNLLRQLRRIMRNNYTTQLLRSLKNMADDERSENQRCIRNRSLRKGFALATFSI